MKPSAPAQLRREIQDLRIRLAEAEETLNAIRNGDVDAMVMGGQVYTLQGAETPYRLLVEAMSEGAALLVGNTIRYCNSQLADLAGQSLEDLIGSSLSRYLNPAETAAFNSLLAEGRNGSSKGEFNLHSLDGRLIPAQFSFSAMPVQGVPGVCVVVTDLTERKRAEAALQLSEERFRQMAENVQEVFWLVDTTQGRILYVSPAYEQVWGRSSQQLYQHPGTWAEAIHPDDLERVHNANQNLGNGNTSLQVEFRIIRPDGTERWIANQGSVIRDKQGKMYRMAGVARDISEQKKLQSEVERVSEMERQRLGHDLHDGLCQYLTAMSMLSDLLKKTLKEKGLKEFTQAETIAVRAREAMQLTHDLSRALYPGSLQIGGLAVALTELSLLIQKMFPIRCRTRIESQKRLADANLERQLFRITQEAAFNAAKHSGGRQIWITLQQAGEWLTLTVKDEGRDPFEEKTAGSGMGLNIMRYRAGLIGASLTITNKPGQGTTVTCKIKNPTLGTVKSTGSGR